MVHTAQYFLGRLEHVQCQRKYFRQSSMENCYESDGDLLKVFWRPQSAAYKDNFYLKLYQKDSKKFQPQVLEYIIHSLSIPLIVWYRGVEPAACTKSCGL